MEKSLRTTVFVSAQVADFREGMALAKGTAAVQPTGGRLRSKVE